MPKRPIETEDLLRIQVPSDPQFSPDGKQMVFVSSSVGDKLKVCGRLWLYDEEGLRQLTFGQCSDAKPRWSPDGAVIAFVSDRKKPKMQIYCLNLRGGEPHPLTGLPEGSVGRFEWSPDGTKIAFLFRERSGERTEKAKEQRKERGESDPPWVIESLHWRLDGDGVFGPARYRLHVLDVATGEDRMVCERGLAGEYAFAWAPDSRRLLVGFNTSDRPTMEPWQEDLFILDVESGELAQVSGYPLGNKGAFSWSPDGRWVALLYTDRTVDRFGVKNSVLCLFDPEKQEWRDITGDQDLDLLTFTLSDLKEPSFEGKLLWNEDSDAVYFNVSRHGSTQVCRVDLAKSEFGSATVEFLTEGNCEHALGSMTRDGARFAVVNPTADSPPEILVLEPTDGGVQAIWRSEFNRSFLDDVEVSVPEEHWVESEPGVKVQTWVIRPPGSDPGKRYPACLEVHGGPHGLYTWCFFFEMQLLAANGYVVVFSNPRGSTGYGEAFGRSIMGDWGVKDWADVQAVTRFLKGLPNVDAGRVAIMGGSYGGFMANWAIGHTDEYRCAITDRSVSNLLSKSGNSDYTFVPDGVWPGAAFDRWEHLWEHSPVKHFKNVKTPTLVIHSEGDLRCNVEQGDQVFTLLAMRGVPARYVRYPASTSHGMSRSGPPDLRMHRLKEILRWYAEYL
ncbi:MAG: S9 family peptidase [Armatimonadetes bacterium]|nr:S9 family peptidase [Armatimonadota bacterium]